MRPDAPLDESGTQEEVCPPANNPPEEEHQGEKWKLSNVLRAGNTDQEIIEGCQQARKAAREWAEWAGFDEEGQQMAAILMSGILTQDTRLLHSLGGFDKELAYKVRSRAKSAKIWHGAGVIGSDWFDEEQGDWTFMLDLMVVCGQIRRVNGKDGYVKYAPLRR